MSIENQQFRMMFQIFADYGWMVLVAIGVIWAILSSKIKGKSILSPASLASVGVVSFLWGVLLTVNATGRIPKIIVSWGSNGQECHAVLDTSRLSGFKKQYDIALVCGVDDATIDKLKNPAITITKPYTIVPGQIQVAERASKLMAEKMPVGATVTVWHEAVLLPKDVHMSSINNLSDVVKRGGKIINQTYWNES